MTFNNNLRDMQCPPFPCQFQHLKGSRLGELFVCWLCSESLSDISPKYSSFAILSAITVAKQRTFKKAPDLF